MKRFLLSIFVISSFIIYSIYQKLGISDEVTQVATTQDLSQSTLGSPSPTEIQSTPTTTQVTRPRQQPTQQPTQPPSQKYKNGELTGNIVDAYYGNVQVKAIISNGKITDVQFLDYPHDRRTSQNINSQAMPMLKSEAIQAQSANVDIVSGATATSQAFQESLQSALSKAQS